MMCVIVLRIKPRIILFSFFFKTSVPSSLLPSFFNLAKSGIRDFYTILTTGFLTQKRQLFGLCGLGFLPIAITFDACRWSIGCQNPNPCGGMAFCLLAGWAEFHSRILVVYKHKFCMPSFAGGDPGVTSANVIPCNIQFPSIGYLKSFLYQKSDVGRLDANFCLLAGPLWGNVWEKVTCQWFKMHITKLLCLVVKVCQMHLLPVFEGVVVSDFAQLQDILQN